MSAAVQIATRVSPQIKDQATRVFSRYGLDMASALRMFVTMAANERKLPLTIDDSLDEVPNDDLAAAIEEGNAIIDGRIKRKGYRSVDELFEALGV
ncbi:MAG: type II toxin-antitoxin system RelB/DinJ family antitoxin [Coriobacteriales bacterium]|jgi:DNA-damage-inducible protein J|nr:type II toxin-antitoxin system RelB/DinJ family antitoxin [Coriobacteriales bacterium]